MNLFQASKEFLITAQLMDYKTVLTIKNWMKTVPFEYGGKSGSLFGTLSVGNFNELNVNRNSGLFTRILNTATQGKITGTIDVKLNINELGIPSLSGTPGQLIAELNTSLLPILQQKFASLKNNGMKIPTGGVKFDWVIFTIPTNTTSVAAKDVQGANIT